jgi:hypothetical protein
VSKGATHGSIKFNAGIFTPVLSIDMFCSVFLLTMMSRTGPGDGGKEREGETEEGGKMMKKRAFPSIQIILLMLN